jgi:hypothetical protein
MSRLHPPSKWTTRQMLSSPLRAIVCVVRLNVAADEESNIGELVAGAFDSERGARERIERVHGEQRRQAEAPKIELVRVPSRH